MVFDELHSSSSEERGFYWFIASRKDGLKINVLLSIYEPGLHLSIRMNETISVIDLDIRRSVQIRVLDVDKHFLEILVSESDERYFLSLQGSDMLVYKDYSE